MVTPGSGRAEMVAELSWLNCSMAAGAAPVSIVTTEDSGTIDAVGRAHVITAPSRSGLSRYSCGDLRDHVVAAVVPVELRDRAAADERAQRLADLADRHAERRCAVAVDDDARLRRVECIEFWTTMKRPVAMRAS